MVSTSGTTTKAQDQALSEYVASGGLGQFSAAAERNRPRSLADFQSETRGTPVTDQSAAATTPPPSQDAASAQQPPKAEAAPVEARPAQPEAGASYTVKPGDNLSKIAKANGMTLKELLDLNKDKLKGRDINLIYPGESFNVTPKAGAAQGKTDAAPSQQTPRRPADAAPGGAAPVATAPEAEAPPSQQTPRRPADAAPGGAAAAGSAPQSSSAEAEEPDNVAALGMP